jgi:ketosteroid isomerase-like protein
MTLAAKELIRELVDAYNAKSVERLLALYRPDARFWDPLHRDGVTGHEAIADVIGGLFATFPDERMSIETLVADDAYAVAEFRSTGTAPGAEPYEVEFTEVYEVSNGQIASCRVYLDTEALPS